ncbi:hypothetical protein V2J09_011885 [Rumex salicifolius]
MGFEKSTSSLTILAITTISIAIFIGQSHGLNVGYYNGKCNTKNVEEIIFNVVREHFVNDNTIVAALLRMQFHDCFVRGCDASILLNGSGTEKTAAPNGSVRGYELIDEAKAAIEKECVGVVSCADVITIATRDAVYLQSGHWYDVETGRLDGLVSLATDANSNLPSPTISVSSALKVFSQRKLDALDFVLLLGGHTVGITHCSFVHDRLYNYQNTNKADPSMNSTLLTSLKNTCPSDKSGASNPIFLDQTPESENVVDDGFYKAIKVNKGVLEIDQRIATDPLTKDIVDELLKGNFLFKFGEAMVKLGRVPNADKSGEIRRSCGAINARVISTTVIVDGIYVGFYNGKCNGGNVEEIIFKVVEKHFVTDKTIVAALLRMQFHDCFVRGCDASILLNGTNTEKTAAPNGSVRGYDLIDAGKNEVEKICPNVVSCADVIVIATRAAVYLQSKHWYNVETGRLDGFVSRASEANSNLPSPTISVSSALGVFSARNLNAKDFVLLLGGHTVGVTHCSFVQNRLYNFQNTGKSDPSMNPNLVSSLNKTCPKDGSGASRTIFLDQTPESGLVVDNGFYRAIKKDMGVLQIDQRIATDPLTKNIVDQLLKEDFLVEFGKAMVKLGRVPRTDMRGEIRRSCGAMNARRVASGGLFGGLIPL